MQTRTYCWAAPSLWTCRSLLRWLFAICSCSSSKRRLSKASRTTRKNWSISRFSSCFQESESAKCWIWCWSNSSRRTAKSRGLALQCTKESRCILFCFVLDMSSKAKSKLARKAPESHIKQETDLKLWRSIWLPLLELSLRQKTWWTCTTSLSGDRLKEVWCRSYSKIQLLINLYGF